MLKYFFKHFKFLLLLVPISLFLLVICLIRTNETTLIKGDTTIIEDVIEIDTENETKGSFSSIYVYNYRDTSLFQSFIAKQIEYAEVNDTPVTTQVLSNEEVRIAGKIQYNQAITNSLVLAYKYANLLDSSISINYNFNGFFVSSKGLDSSFKIYDQIVEIKARVNDYNLVGLDNEELFRTTINSKYVGDTYTIIRNNEKINITLTENDTFSAYSMYQINSSTPSFTLKSSSTLGPSGGLLQTLAVYNKLVKEDITHGLKICGTGTIRYDGVVGVIGGIKEKIYTAVDDHMDVFFCPKDNYSEAKEAYDKINNCKMKLIMVSHFEDCINYLKEGYLNDF